MSCLVDINLKSNSLTLNTKNTANLGHISQSVNQSISQSVNQSISQSINQSIQSNQSIIQSVNQSISQSVNQSISQFSQFSQA